MPTLGDLTVRIGADDSQYKDTMKSVSDSLKSFASEAFTVAKDLIGGVSAVFTAAGLSDKIFDTHAVDTMKTTILDFASSTKAAMTEVGASVSGAAAAATEAAASTAAAMGTIGSAAGAAASGVSSFATALSGATSVVYEFGSGLVTAGIQAAGGILFAGLTAGAVVAGAAILQLVQATDQQITAQAILAAQTGNSFVDVATFQNAGNSLGVGNGLLDLLGGGNLSGDLAQLSQLAAGITGFDQAISSTFQNASTQGGIEQLVAAFQALPDPIDRANLAVQLFGKNATEGLALMNQATVDAVNHANELATAYDTATRESLQRITDNWASFKNFILAPFDFSTIWSDLKSGMIVAITSIEEPWHTFFVQLESDWHDAVNSINLWLQSHGIVINAVPNLSDAQMAAIMKGAMGSATTPGSPMAVPSSADATLAAGGGIGAIYDQANASIARMTDSYASLTDGLGAAQAKLLSLQNQFQADHSNLIIADQVDKQQALVDKIQATKDALDEYLLVWQGIGKAQSTLSMPDFQKQFDDIANAFATIQQNSGLFTSGQLEAAAGNFQTAMDNLSGSVRGGKAALDDFGQGTWSGPTIGYLAAVQKQTDATSNSAQKLADIIKNWKVTPIDVLTIPESDLSAFQTEANVYEDYLKKFPQLLDDIQAATLKVDLRSLTGIYDAPNQALITLEGNLNRVAGTIVGTATILNSEGTQSTVQFAEAARLAADNYAQITKNVEAGKATIQDQAAAYNVWAQAALKVQGATAAIADQEHTLAAAIIEERSASGSANADEEAALDRIKLQLSGQYDLYQNIHTEVTSIFTTMDASIASAIVNWQGFGNLVDSIFKSLGQSLIKNVLDAISKPISITISESIANSGAGKAIGGLLGLGGGSSGSGAVSDIAGGSSSVPGAVDWATSGGGSAASAGGSAASSGGSAASSAGSLLGSVANVANIVGAAATVISGIVQGFQMAHLESLTGEIEVTTRQIANVVALNGGETIFAYTKLTWQATQVMINELAQLHSDMVEFAGTGGGGGGTNFTGTTADLLSQLLGGMLTNATTNTNSAQAMSNAASSMSQSAVDNLTATAALTAISQTATNILNNPIDSAPTSLTQLAPSPTSDQLIQAQKDLAASITGSLSPALQAQSSLITQAMQASLDQAHALIDAGNQALLTAQQIAALANENGMATQAAIAQHTAFALNLKANPTPVGYTPDAFGQMQDILAQGFGIESQGGLTAAQIAAGVQSPFTAAQQAAYNATQAQVAAQGGPGGALSTTFQTGGMPTEAGAALGVSTGALQWNPNPLNSAGIVTTMPSGALLPWQDIESNYMAKFSQPSGGWGAYFESLGIPKSAIGPSLYNSSYVNTSQMTPSHTADPGASPTSSSLVPSSPVNQIGNGMPITINALDPSAKGVGDALIQYLRSNGMKV